MKKNNKMVKFTAILATALMAVSATGISTSAQGVKQMEAAKTADSAASARFAAGLFLLSLKNCALYGKTHDKPSEL